MLTGPDSQGSTVSCRCGIFEKAFFFFSFIIKAIRMPLLYVFDGRG